MLNFKAIWSNVGDHTQSDGVKNHMLVVKFKSAYQIEVRRGIRLNWSLNFMVKLTIIVKTLPSTPRVSATGIWAQRDGRGMEPPLSPLRRHAVKSGSRELK